ncbi:MAG TPA: hypothetical protein PK659_08910 [Methanothrix sp.]|nr:hypothetical protein [Methanothrix sp.]HOL44356.1 hypothetical protein [Methanothrix sp.]
MPVYGNKNAFVGLVIELRAIGPVPIIIGQGICGIVGTSSRGPTNEAVPVGMPTTGKRLYHSGDLKEAVELAFQQGCPVVYAVRVLGSGNKKASHDVKDEASTPTKVGTFYATSEGIWGNSVIITIEDGEYKSTDVEIFGGDDTVGPYALKVCDIIESPRNYVKVNGIPRKIVYDEDELGEGEVFVDTQNGKIKFYTDEAPTTAETISVYVKYKTINVILTDNEITETYRNIRDLIDLQARLRSSVLATFTPAAGALHLPANGTFALSEGSDGEEITTDDWEQALYLLGNTIAPTTVAITSYEVKPMSYDLIPVLDGFVTWMANRFQPCIGFVSARENESVANLLDLAAGYNNRLLVIEGNGWDQSNPRKNLAVAHAAKEAAVALGESTALARNSLNGVRDLLVTFNQDEMDALTRGGINVFMKQRGIKPYVSISTATDWQFMRCVDNRTINWIITALDYVCKQFYHQRRTPEVLTALKASIEGILDEQVTLGNVEKYHVEVVPSEIDINRVDVELLVQNIGHIERVRVVFGVGVLLNE